MAITDFPVGTRVMFHPLEGWYKHRPRTPGKIYVITKADVSAKTLRISNDDCDTGLTYSWDYWETIARISHSLLLKKESK